MWGLKSGLQDALLVFIHFHVLLFFLSKVGVHFPYPFGMDLWLIFRQRNLSGSIVCQFLSTKIPHSLSPSVGWCRKFQRFRERRWKKKKKKERRLDPWMTACVHCTLLTHTGFWKECEINFYYNYLQRFADFFNVIAVSYPEMLRFADKIRSSTYRLSHISSHSISDFWLEVYNTFRSPRILYHILSSLLMCSSYK